MRFRISEPYHTVGGEADFDKFVGIKHVDSLGVGETNVFVEWTPETAAEPHACVLVDLINLVGTDTNDNDNWAQENLEIVASITEQPVPAGDLQLQPDQSVRSRPCFISGRKEPRTGGRWTSIRARSVSTRASAWWRRPLSRRPKTPRSAPASGSRSLAGRARGDTLINVGGGVVQVDLRRPVAINLKAEPGRCRGQDWEILLQEAKKQGKKLDPEIVRKRCGRIDVQGCMEPPIAGQEIILKYVDPLGNVTYRTVKTDENGCFEDFFVSVTGGTWQVSAEYPGGRCEAPEVEGPVTVCWCHD